MGGHREIYDNGEKSLALFKCRTNTLDLGDRKRSHNETTECTMCGDELEDLGHFILHCPAYDEDRRKNLSLQHPHQQDQECVIGKLFFDNNDIENIKTTLHRFWQRRERKIKEMAP